MDLIELQQHVLRRALKYPLRDRYDPRRSPAGRPLEIDYEEVGEY
jgi:hypothetical protein